MQNDDLHSERELFSQIAEGDEMAFAAVFHKYNSQLFPGVYKVLKSQAEAEEVIQNTFLKLWLGRRQLPEIEKPGAWLFRVASNLALNALRDKATYRHYTADAGNPNTEEESNVLNDISAKELKSFIAEAVQLMPAARQEVFRLSRQEGLSRQEIAQQLGIAESTVKNQLTSSLKFIQEFIVKKYGIQLPVIFFLLFK